MKIPTKIIEAGKTYILTESDRQILKDAKESDEKAGDFKYPAYYATKKAILKSLKAEKAAAEFPIGGPVTVGGSYAKPAAAKKEVEKIVSKCYLCKEDLCPVCNVCESDNCKLSGYRATSRSEMIALGTGITANTQKARGYTILSKEVAVPKPFEVITEEEDIPVVTGKHGSREFMVRPCPVRPRHGFVESRPVKFGASDAADQVKKIFAEARAADPEAELLCCPMIKADFNVVITPILLGIGPGHDGATAGKSSIAIPLVEHNFLPLRADTCKRAGVHDGEDTFIEAVTTSDGSTMFTQLRAGDKLPRTGAKDYCPFTLRVERVVEATGDLVEWEAICRTFTPGTVAWHPGGNMTSHYAIHCVHSKIPIFISRKPEVGEVLEEISGFIPPSPDAVVKGIAAGWVFPLDTQVKGRQALTMMMVAVHNALAMRAEDGFYLGAAASIMHRFGIAAALGEMRHSTNCRNIAELHGGGYAKRGSIYNDALAADLNFNGRIRSGAIYDVFQYGSWGSSYGGPKWANCVHAVIEMDRQMMNVMQHPTEANVSELVKTVNNAVNQAHNGGWWLNKFIEQVYFNYASEQHMNGLTYAAPAFYRLHEFGKSLGKDNIQAVFDNWFSEPVIIPSEDLPRIGKEEKESPKAAKKKEEPPALQMIAAHVQYIHNISKSGHHQMGLHWQYKITGQEGTTPPYQSGDIMLSESNIKMSGSEFAKWCAETGWKHSTCEATWSGSGNPKYLPLQFTLKGDNVWEMKEPLLGVTFQIAIPSAPPTYEDYIAGGGEESNSKAIKAGVKVNYTTWSEMVPPNPGVKGGLDGQKAQEAQASPF